MKTIEELKEELKQIELDIKTRITNFVERNKGVSVEMNLDTEKHYHPTKIDTEGLYINIKIETKLHIDL